MLGKIVSSRLENLEQEFLNSGGEWKKYYIESVFDLVPTKCIFHANQLEIFDNEIEGSFPYVVRSERNNGVKGYIQKEKKYLNPKNTISFAQDTFIAFWQEKPYFTGNKIKVLIPKEENINRKIGLFFVSSINKVLSDMSWGVGSTEEEIKKYVITLPCLNGEICFSYMEKYIEKLEELYIEELEAYLIATGLKDYKLTKYDEEILDRFNKLSENYLDRQVRLEDILEWQTGIREIDPLKLNVLYQEGEEYPFYGQATENNGIISYVSLQKEVLNNKYSLPTILIHSNNQNIVYLETPFYLKDGHGATSVLQNKNMTCKSALYFMGAIKKVIEERFDYNSKATKIGLKNTIIELPIYDKGVDYKFMEDFITVVEKLVIKEVMLWYDKKIIRQSE
ncbi:restriction endonuclease subunit S [Clostridium perfringens]|uniref:restriction endonuclease subunit S n=1 Tax=Clostridium perfringens TaxID=1502 RepID=UPI00233FD07D|nr:restriction endonuclease subunit S [Clostridium perfringens]MDC4244074.1 restriction endonuclease subunit S [Clostridium perfringens]